MIGALVVSISFFKVSAKGETVSHANGCVITFIPTDDFPYSKEDGNKVYLRYVKDTGKGYSETTENALEMTKNEDGTWTIELKLVPTYIYLGNGKITNNMYADGDWSKKVNCNVNELLEVIAIVNKSDHLIGHCYIDDGTKKPLTIETSGYEGIYDNVAHSINVDVKGADVEIYYSTEELTKDNYTTKGYKTAPSFIDASETTVYYYVVGSKYKPEAIAGNEKVIIKKAVMKKEDLTDDQKPKADGNISGKNEANLVIAPYELPNGYTEIRYSTDGKNYSSRIPTANNEGTYHVDVKYIGDKNHEDFDGYALDVSIVAPDVIPDKTESKEEETETLPSAKDNTTETTISAQKDETLPSVKDNTTETTISVQEDETSSSAKDTNWMPLWILIIILLAAVVGIICYIHRKKRGNHSGQSTE